MRTMGGRLKDTHARLRELQTERVERRIAHAIARLVAQAGRRVEGGILIDFPVSRQDIAEMTGTTLHTVSRTLSAWQERGIVKPGRQKLTVVDPHGLVVIAARSEEHTSELQSLMRISYAVFCSKTKTKQRP